MKVIFASYHCCIRVVKEGLALMKAGIDIIFLQKQISNEAFINILPCCSFFSDPESFAIRLNSLKKGCDLVHVHNEPDWIGHIAKEVVGDMPVIFDAHDLNSIREGKMHPDEVKSMEVCDGFIFPSIPYEQMTVETYKLKKPTVIVYSMCNEDVLDFPPLPRVNGIVYEGGIVGSHIKNPLEYRNYLLLSKFLTDHGIPLFIYGIGLELQNEYGSTGAIPMGRLTYFSLLRQLSRYDWGFLGSCEPHPQWQTAMPNKLFEYLAAGIPVMALYADECSKFIREHGIGVVLESMEQIPEIYDEHEKYRRVVMEKRRQFTMEKEIGKVLELYGKVLIRNVSKDKDFEIRKDLRPQTIM